MSYANVSWEISTGDPQRAVRIANAADLALGSFNPARLLANSWLVDTENQPVEAIRNALDSVVVSFPQEFFYSVSDQDEADIQGIYPPFADLGAARAITDDQRNPRSRPQPQAPAPIAAPPAGHRRRAGAAGSTARRQRESAAAGGVGRSRQADRRTRREASGGRKMARRKGTRGESASRKRTHR